MRDPDGYPVGSLCVIDPRARQLDAGQLAALRDLAGQAEQLLALRREHAQLLDVLAEVDHRASHDPLTGLLNRRLLLDRLSHALRCADRGAVPPTVFFCDLDAFNAVNDTFGHDAGDQALVAVGHALRAAVRPADTVARLGGDEFVVVCDDLPPDAVGVVADRLRQITVSTGPDRAGRLGVSVGVITAAVPTTAGAVLERADQAMYAEKAARRAAAAS